jgi:hypothetical protein
VGADFRALARGTTGFYRSRRFPLPTASARGQLSVLCNGIALISTGSKAEWKVSSSMSRPLANASNWRRCSRDLIGCSQRMMAAGPAFSCSCYLISQIPRQKEPWIMKQCRISNSGCGTVYLDESATTAQTLSKCHRHVLAADQWVKPWFPSLPNIKLRYNLITTCD